MIGPKDLLATKGYSEGNECVVCMEEFKQGEAVWTLISDHRFHGHCISKWKKISSSMSLVSISLPLTLIIFRVLVRIIIRQTEMKNSFELFVYKIELSYININLNNDANYTRNKKKTTFSFSSLTTHEF